MRHRAVMGAGTFGSGFESRWRGVQPPFRSQLFRHATRRCVTSRRPVASGGDSLKRCCAVRPDQSSSPIWVRPGGDWWDGSGSGLAQICSESSAPVPPSAIPAVEPRWCGCVVIELLRRFEALVVALFRCLEDSRVMVLILRVVSSPASYQWRQAV